MRKALSALALTVAALSASPLAAGAATVHAASVAAPALGAGHGHGGHGHGHGGHHAPNCNNDPSSGYAMDPDVCPLSNNGNVYDDGDPGEY